MRSLWRKLWLRFFHTHVFGQWSAPIPCLMDLADGSSVEFTVRRRFCVCGAREIASGD